jgi:hypothetical protein
LAQAVQQHLPMMVRML